MHFLVSGILDIAFSTTVSFHTYCILLFPERGETQVFSYHLMGQLHYESLCWHSPDWGKNPAPIQTLVSFSCISLQMRWCQGVQGSLIVALFKTDL